MSDPVDVFRRISWLIIKWLLIVFAVLVGLTAVAFGVGYGYTYYTHDRHLKNIEFVVAADKDKCTDDKFPILVLIFNRSEKTIEKVNFSVKARRKGRSTDITASHYLTDDNVREPHKTEAWAQCWNIPLQSNVTDKPRDLEWSPGTISYTFRE